MSNLGGNMKKSAIKRKQIVDAFAGLIDEEGIKNVTVKMVCERAGVALGTFYHYFDSKQSIVDQMYKTLDDCMFYNKDLFKEKSVKENILKFIDLLETYFDDWGYYANRLMIQTSLKNTDKQDSRKLYTILKEIVESGYSHNSEVDVQYLVDVIFMAIRGHLLYWAKNGVDYSIRGKIKQNVELLLKSFPD